MLGKIEFENNYRKIEQNVILDKIIDINYQEIPPLFEALPLSNTALTLSLSNEKIGLVRENHFEEFCEINFRSFTS